MSDPAGAGAERAASGFNWMPAPQGAALGCPAGLEYLTQIDRLLVSRYLEGIKLLSFLSVQVFTLLAGQCDSFMSLPGQVTKLYHGPSTRQE